MSIEQRLAELGVTLPEPAAPVEEAPAAAPATSPVKGLAMKGTAKRPGVKAPGAPRQAPAPASEPTPEPEAEAPAAEAVPAAETEANGAAGNGHADGDAAQPPAAKPGGLGFKSGAKAPGKRN